MLGLAQTQTSGTLASERRDVCEHRRGLFSRYTGFGLTCLTKEHEEPERDGVFF